LRKTLEGTIQAIGIMLSKKDPYTEGHQKRVANLASAIAKEMGLSDDQVEGIRIAGILHDVGKISVPSEILSRPSKLKDMEFELIKTHSQFSFEILKEIEFPWPIARISIQHHERMNGSGYPFGLANGNILMEARILAVADVVESMSSHRPYRPAFGIDLALEEISRNRGVLYDADVVDVCVRLFHEKRSIFE
jgi:putative nucleotidyltransferase with HDIG domain